VSSETQVSSRRQCWSIQDQRSRCILTALLIHQRHTQTDDMRSQDRALHYRASRGKNQETPYQSVDPSESREAVFHHNLDRLQSLKLRAIFCEQMAHLRRIDLRFQPMSVRPSVLAEIQYSGPAACREVVSMTILIASIHSTSSACMQSLCITPAWSLLN